VNFEGLLREKRENGAVRFM